MTNGAGSAEVVDCGRGDSAAARTGSRRNKAAISAARFIVSLLVDAANARHPFNYATGGVSREQKVLNGSSKAAAAMHGCICSGTQSATRVAASGLGICRAGSGPDAGSGATVKSGPQVSRATLRGKP